MNSKGVNEMQEIKIYVPTWNKKYIEDICKQLTQIFHKCEYTSGATGYWKNPDTQQIEIDDITVFTVLTKCLTNRKRNQLKDILKQIKKDLKQICVAFGIDEHPEKEKIFILENEDFKPLENPN